MGCGRSRYFHDDERGVPDGVLLAVPLTEQRLEIVRDLDTDNDQKGRVAVDNIFRPTREIYGQKAEDMTEQAIDWKDYGIVFKTRPRPQDFPAFANAKLLMEMMQQKNTADKQEDIQKTLDHDLSSDWCDPTKVAFPSLGCISYTDRTVIEVGYGTLPTGNRVMCVTFLYLNADAVGDGSKYQLIVLNNRDENFDRPTSLAAWEGDVLAGRDEALSNEKGGTWLGMKSDGKVGILLSMLEKDSLVIPGAPTRGKIVNEYLHSDYTAEEYGQRIAKRAHVFNGFNVLLLDRIKQMDGQKAYRVVNFINRQGGPETLGSGVYGFGNSLRRTPFKKVSYGARIFEEKLQQLNGRSKQEIFEEFIGILRDDTCHHPDEQLMSQTDQPEECSKAMSQLFFRFPPPFRYGTRSHTVILVDGLGHVDYLERSQIPPSKDFTNIHWVDSVYEFDIVD